MGFKSFFDKKIMRKRPQSEAKLVADIDAILNEPVQFRLLGKDYVIKPLNLEQFLQCTRAIDQIAGLEKQKNVTAEYVVELYCDLMDSVCVKIPRKDLMKLSQQQLTALFSMIIEIISGKAFVEKKTLMTTQKV